jgi:hypothetical protein
MTALTAGSVASSNLISMGGAQGGGGFLFEDLISSADLLTW